MTGVTRRGFLLGGMAALPGCAGVVFGRPGPFAPRYTHDGPSRLRIAVFEVEPIDFMMHTGLIIYTPDDRVLYDPGGFWRDPRAVRRLDVTRGFSPELEASYLSRSSLLSSADIWTLHLWETEVPDAVALQAVEIAESREPYCFGGCAYGVSSLLRELPGFEGVRTSLIPANLVRYLHARADMQYSSRELGGGQQEA
ncbi:MAG: hypothetical protein JJU15_06680 [Pararhodobacter sp.]|nr:hypothetical protein [Pararhodobacter sp.]